MNDTQQDRRNDTRYLSSCSAFMSTLQADNLGGYAAQLKFLMQQANHIRRELRRAVGVARPITWSVGTTWLRLSSGPTYRMQGSYLRSSTDVVWHYMQSATSTRCGITWGDDTCLTVLVNRITCPDCLRVMGLT